MPEPFVNRTDVGNQNISASDIALANELVAKANAAEQGGTPLTEIEASNLKILIRRGLIEAKGETADELILRGLREADEKRKAEIGEHLDAAANLAWEARHKVRAKVNYLLFGTRMEADARLKEIRVAMDEHIKAVAKLKGSLPGPEHQDFKRLVDDQAAEIERVFRGESQ